MAGGNKEKVILAAMELFHLKGFQATGLEEILSRSGVCKSNFYYHFKSKDELGLSVLEEKVKEMRRDYMVPTLEDRSYPPKERLIRFFHEMIRFCDSHGCQRGCIFGNLTLELADHHEEMRARLESFFKELEEKILSNLKEGKADGSLDLKGMNPVELATAVVSLLQGGILLTKGYKETAPLASSLKLLSRFLDVEAGEGESSV